MKHQFIVTLLAAAGLCLFTGCETVTETVRERFQPVPPRVRQFSADTRQVSHAVVLAFKRLDFSLTGPVSPTGIEAASPIHTNVALGDSRQLLARVKLSDAGAGKTDVALLVLEEVAETSAAAGGGSDRALRENGFYDTFFAMLQQVLEEHPADLAASPEKDVAK